MPDPSTFLQDPDFLPFKLDLSGNRLLLVGLTPRQRGEASFLDERALRPDTQGVWVPLDAVLEAHQPITAAPLDFIFHIGHCGSTLLSRLVQAWPGVQALREPLPLRTLAGVEADVRRDALLSRLCDLWARRPAGVARTVVKATSSCNGLIEPLLAFRPQARAILLQAPLRSYLATILKSQDSLRDVQAAWPGRAAVLRRHGVGIDTALAADDPVLPVAAGWLAEQLRFDALERGPYGERLLRVDFEALLAAPQRVLEDIARHFDLPAQDLDAALGSPEWRRYSKATTHAYDADDRAHDLQRVEQRFGASIDRAVRWVERQRLSC